MPTAKPAESVPTANQHPTDRRRAVLCAGLCLLTAVALLRACRQAPFDPGQPPSGSLAICIDPNEDPWWKLTALPGVGATRARRIVQYREESPVPRPFRRAEDLEAVRGIGPITVRRAAPLLCEP